jgi:glycosyltransferase involved in cell wall biosynthesis
MRILHVIHQYLPEKIGGTELYTQTLAQHQAQQGHKVALFTPTTNQPITDHGLRITDHGLRTYYIPSGERTPTAVLRSNFHHPTLDHAFAQVLAEERPDIVHIQHLMGLPLSLVRHIRRASIPYLVTLHDYWYLCANAQLLTNYDETVCAGPKWWLNCAHCALARLGHRQAYPLIPPVAPLFAYRHGRLQSILHHAAALIAPSHFTANIYQQLGIAPDKINVIPHGIAVPAQPPPRQPHTGLHIGYIGGIAPQKGVHTLIEAVNQLTDCGLRLTVYGDLAAFPAYAARLQQEAAHPAITFAGPLPHEQLWQAMAELDVVVVPTLWYETASLIVQEAFAAGVPVVASDIGVLPERVGQGVDGLLFPPGDVDALQAILLQLYQQPERLAELRAGIQPVFTIAEHGEAVTAVYRQAAKLEIRN